MNSKLGPQISRMLAKGKGNFAGGKFARTFVKTVNNNKVTFAHLFIEGKVKALPALKALGVEINTVTSSGIMTAIAPLGKIQAIAAMADVTRIHMATSVKLHMDKSAGPGGVNIPDMAKDRLDQAGEGVIVGVIDTGIDFNHPDFLIAPNDSRVLAIWDHTLDPGDVSFTASNPAGFTYGTVCDTDMINAGTCQHLDNHGHGTHVAGTSAGNGNGAFYTGDTYPDGTTVGPYTGLAPKAKLVIVKFDFENVKDRNTTTAIVDGINWIFQTAAAANMPAVINMSLGSDYGPHDGSTPEERGIDDLTGPGNIVAVSAGNSAVEYNLNAWKLWGAPIHGSGNFSTSNDITFDLSEYTPTAGDDYVFFDIWYPGASTCRVQITTPSGAVYPPYLNRNYRTLWATGGQAGGFATPDGVIYVENTTGEIAWDSDSGDNNIYIEISDSSGTNPGAGQWKIELIPLSGADDYQAWQGYSSSIGTNYFYYDGGNLSDSISTIGKPATASSVISIGAYQTKNVWPAREYVSDEEGDWIFKWQAYGEEPITYYDPYYLGDLAFFSSRGPDRNGNIQPFISAPGVGIVAALSQTALDDGSSYTDNYYKKYDRVEWMGMYTTMQGTSMSCPHATGSIALLLEKAKDGGLAPTPAEVKDYLQAGAKVDGFTDAEPTGAAPNNDWGHGKIDVTGSLAVIPGNDPCTDDASCDDNNVCNGAETCVSGACVAGTALPCTDDDADCTNACTTYSCDAVDGWVGTPIPDCCTADSECTTTEECSVAQGACVDNACVFTYVADDTDCADGQCCGGSCTAPICTASADCDDGDICTVDTCEGADTCAAACKNVLNIFNPDCVCAPADESCTTNSDCCSGRCHPRKLTCK